MANEELLSIYLNDHLAASIAGYEVAKRSRASNEGTQFEDFLARLVQEIELDQEALEKVMDRLGVRRNHAKQAGAWLFEKIGRLKLNGQLIGYSDLSRVIELEGLTVGVEGKLSLWHNLKTIAATDERLTAISFDELIDRAERQRKDLEDERLEAARIAFA
jgi:hypothetical protein